MPVPVRVTNGFPQELLIARAVATFCAKLRIKLLTFLSRVLLK